MNRNHLAVFHAVAEAGGFSRGAEVLMVSQPAVSQQVAELESSLGVQLLDRLPRGVRLTKAGQLLFNYARQISSLEQEAQRSIREILGLERGRLVVGASLTIGSYMMPQVLCDFRNRYPGVELELEIANTHEIQDRLLSGKLDLAMTEGFIESEELDSTVFSHDELVAVAPAGHLLSKKRHVTAQDLCKQPLIFRETGSGTRAIVERALAKKGFVVRPIMSMGSAEAIKAAVVRGMGLAVMSRLAVAKELAEGSLVIVPLADLTIHRDLHRLLVRGRSLGPAGEKFLSLISPNHTTSTRKHGGSSSVA